MIRTILLLILSMAFWGGAWTSGKIISGSLSSSTIIFWRFLMAALAMIPAAPLLKSPLSLPRRHLFKPALGALFFTAYNQLFFQGLREGLAGAGGVLVTTLNPLFTHTMVLLLLALSRRRRKTAGVPATPGSKPEETRPREKTERPLIRRLLTPAGLIIGLAGGMIMIQFWSLSPQVLLQGGNGYFLLAALVFSGATLTNGRYQSGLPFVGYTLAFYGFSALYSLFFSLAAGDTLAVFSRGPLFWGNLLYLSLLAMAFASSFYFLAASRLGGHHASSFIFLVPLFALLFSFLFLGEVPQAHTLTGGALALTAVYLLARSR